MWNSPWVRAAVDSGETDRGRVREEIVVGNAFGGKPGSHGSKVILLSHIWGWSQHHSLSPPTQQHWQLNNREAVPIKCLMPGTTQQDPPWRPFECLMC